MNRYEKLFGTKTNDDNKKSLLDPRPDIASDHSRWELVLANAKAVFDIHKPVNDAGETSLFKILHGLRCGGARLEETKRAYKLYPGNTELVEPVEWDKVKRHWLDPVKNDLITLFKICKVGQVTDEKLPDDIAIQFDKKNGNEAVGESGQQKQQLSLEFM